MKVKKILYTKHIYKFIIYIRNKLYAHIYISDIITVNFCNFKFTVAPRSVENQYLTKKIDHAKRILCLNLAF